MFVSRETQEKIDALESENAELKKKLSEVEAMNSSSKSSLKTGMIIAWVLFVVAAAAAIYFYLKPGAASVDSSTPIYTASGKLDWNTIPDSSITYTVQIGAFAEFDIAPFASQLEGVYVFENDSLQKLSLGTFSNFTQAQTFLHKMSEMGLEFAYITVYKNGEPIGIMDARKDEE